jgi:hypothetical protein
MLLHYLVPSDVFMRRTQLAAAIAGLSFLAACSSDSTGVGAQSGSSIAFSAGSSSASAALASVVPITKNGHTLDVTSITVVITRASLKSTQTDICMADDDDEDDDHGGSSDRGPGRGHSGDDHCGEIRVGPTIVDLPVDGKLVTIPGNTIPAGTFSEIDLRISLVRLQGTFDTKPFDVTVPVGAKTEIKLDPPITVTADTPVAVTVNLPVDTWLLNTDGSLIDPNQLRTNLVLLARVKMNIASSIHAFEDRDHDGRPDHRRD